MAGKRPHEQVVAVPKSKKKKKTVVLVASAAEAVAELAAITSQPRQDLGAGPAGAAPSTGGPGKDGTGESDADTRYDLVNSL